MSFRAPNPEGSAYDNSAHDNSAHEGSVHEGSNHERSIGEGSDVEGSDVEGCDFEGPDSDDADSDGADSDGADSDGADSIDSAEYHMYRISSLENPLTSDWNLPLSLSDFDKLLEGFRPAMIEDSWRIKKISQEDNTFTINFHRVGTGITFYTLEVSADHPAGNGPAMKSIKWEGFPLSALNLTDVMAKDAVVHLLRYFSVCELEGYPEIDLNKIRENGGT